MSGHYIQRVAMVLLGFVITPATAQVSELDPVTVTVTRVEKTLEEIPAAVSAVDQDEIQLGTEQLGLDESLGRVPGLFFLNRYNFAQDLRASIRGFGARSSFGIRGIKIIVDGIPETLPDGQGSVDGIDLGSARQISVIRGPASSLYGNASGGAIIVETEQGAAEPFVEWRTSSGDFGFLKNQFKAGGDQNDLNYLFSVSKTEIDGYRDHSEAENTQMNGRFELDISDKSSLLASIHHTDQPLANDPGGINAESVSADRTAARERNVSFDTGEALKQTRVGLLYKTELAADRSLETRVYQTRRDFSNKLPFEEGGAVALDRDFVGAGLKYTITGELAGRPNRLLLGFDYDRQNDDRSRFENLSGVVGSKTFEQNERVTSHGVYLQDEIDLNSSMELTVGARYDDLEFDVTDRFLENGDDSGKVSFDQISPMAGLSFATSDHTRLYATISTAFETPTTTEFANPVGGGFNQMLDPQKSTNYEIGLKSLTETQSFDVALFHIQVEDELIPFELSDQPGRTFYENAGSSSRNGLEIAWTRKLGSGFELSSAWTWSDFSFDTFRNAGGDIFDGNRIPGVPKSLFYVDISWFGDTGFYASWDASVAGSMFADNANDTRVDSYTVSNLKSGYNGFAGDWEFSFFAGVNNLFDEDYNNNIRINAFGKRYYEPAPDRNTFFGITVRRNFSG